MEPRFEASKYEKTIYDFWAEQGYLRPKKGKPFTILMPPPNANASLHAGHGMYTIEDIVIRYKRLRGFASLWIPGTDHAGFETQFVFEKELAKKGQSRMNFDRETLYQMIYDFVKNNSGLIYQQFKRLGFLADWDRSVFTLDPQVINFVYSTFQKMVDQGLVYRDNYIVNYCTHCGTSLAELEVKYIERKDPLYYLKYGPFILATVRPETKFGDTAVAVHPDDKRYKAWINKEIEVDGLLGKFKIKVIADEIVDPKFGTGVVKITPAHDPNDFETGKRHNLEIKKVINIDGRLNELTGPYAGLKVKAARQKTVEDLLKSGLIEKIDNNYEHSVTTCYKCGRDLEPTIIPNWFIKVEPLKKPVIKAISTNKVEFIPKKYKKQILDWLEIMHDWPISRQIVWGIRIPVWYKLEKSRNNIDVWWLDKNKKLNFGNIDKFLNTGISLSEIRSGLQQVSVATGSMQPSFVISDKSPGDNYLPETNTFDTWFSSGQWPLVTLKKHELTTRFPTDFMGTLSDILKFWISRMIMFSLYLTIDVPFRHVYLWSMVCDSKGVKMSKSKGNVINPIDMVDKYGADAFRSSLLFGIGEGGTVNLAEDKVRSMRNFTNKIWNIGRFIYMNRPPCLPREALAKRGHSEDPPAGGAEGSQTLKDLDKEFKTLKQKVLKQMDTYKFSAAFGDLYEFIWHRFADHYIEKLKEAVIAGDDKALHTLEKTYLEAISLLHPFIPFVTEAIWQSYYGRDCSILDSKIDQS